MNVCSLSLYKNSHSMTPTSLWILCFFKGSRFALQLFAFVSFLRIVDAESCPASPATSTICSQDHAYTDDRGNFQVSGKCVAGNKCECSPDFTGKACEIPIRAAATNVLMNSWVFLAKNCWTASAQGKMDVVIKYTSWNCSTGKGCSPANETSPERLPQIMFYSSYDEKFSQSVLKSYTTNSFGGGLSDSDRPCFGNSAVYKEKITCSDYTPSMVRALRTGTGPV